MIDFQRKRTNIQKKEAAGPTVSASPKLYVINEEQGKLALDPIEIDTLFKNNQGKILFGRSTECQFQFTGRNSVSHVHFSIENINDNFYITDLGSKNGTYVDKQRIQGQHLLGGKSVISAGKVKLLFCID